jgi:Cation/multidrug efflux pump
MKNLPSFSVILVFVVLMIIGAAVIPLTNVKYAPSIKNNSINISFNWNGASAKLIELDVTSKIEGLVSNVKGVSGVSSVSKKGWGNVTVKLKKSEDVRNARFEISQIIRHVYNKLPEGCSYPHISGTVSGTSLRPVMTFIVNANLSAGAIKEYVQEHIIKELSLINGVNSVSLHGAVLNYIEILYNPQTLKSVGLSGDDVKNAISNNIGKNHLIGSIDGIGISLKCDTEYKGLEDIPIKNVNNRIIRVRDVANITVKPQTPDSYYRINGLNTININIYPEKDVNTIKLNKTIKEKMQILESSFPNNFSVITSYDASVNIKTEINKIFKRAILSLLILLMFVLIISRSFKYLGIISFSLLANILIAFILYVLFNIEIHLYSLAGITVSLGIIIDTSIIMISHYGYYRNRKVFIAILAAQITSIGALIVIFLLPKVQRASLTDFSGVIIINLAISLLISLLLIPALIDTFGTGERKNNKKVKLKGKRLVIKFNNIYSKYIIFGKRFKWATLIILILGFGLPINLLPEKLGKQKEYIEALPNNNSQNGTLCERLYNSTLGSEFFVKNIKPILYKITGGSLRLFLDNENKFNFNNEPQRKQLSIYAGLPDGCTTAQLNEVILNMENYLSKFDEIESFNTRVNSNKDASISVLFKPDIENTIFPQTLKTNVINKAQDFGGANWRVYGLDEIGFSNYIGEAYKYHRIIITGYNYDDLYKYCLNLVNSIKHNPRVKDPDIYGEMGWNSELNSYEYYIDYDTEKMSMYGISPDQAYSVLTNLLNSSYAGAYTIKSKNDKNAKNEKLGVYVTSGMKNSFDVWNLKNSYIQVGNMSVKFSDLGTIEKRKTGNNIYRENQQYSLIVAFDFIGSENIASKLIKKEIDRLNNEVLPIGYKAYKAEYSWEDFLKQNIYLILVVIAVIFFICSILFESLKYPLIIIGLIPVSFIGMLLTFAIAGTTFDQGGFAAMVMLCGIVVNAGIYLLNEFKNQKTIKLYHNTSIINDTNNNIQNITIINNNTDNSTKKIADNNINSKTTYLKYYIRAFNHKIIPIFLTIISTLLGLIPFLIDGPNEVFWFAFALGTIGGLLFSLISLILFMPIWVPMKHKY